MTQDAGIYLIRGERDLVEMTERPYDSEDLLQELLAKYPRVLGGSHFDGDQPRRWLLLTREAPIRDSESGADRWSIDHLFADPDGVPTLVEVKRKSDTRLRREVVGQMLDYAAHSKFWGISRLEELFRTRCAKDNADPEEVLRDFLSGGDPIMFWNSLEANLASRHIRLIFVADRVPSELQHIVEFLAEQMTPAEILAIEVRQYVSSDTPPLRTLVPRVIGANAIHENAVQRGLRWTAERFHEKLAEDATPAEVALADQLLQFSAELTGKPVEWGTGKQRGSFTSSITEGGERFSLFSLYTTGEYSINIYWNHGERAKQLSEDFRPRCLAALGFDYAEKATWTNPEARRWRRSPAYFRTTRRDSRL